ncbi:helix-turn-helix domain-containing protein [Schleiferilactobacillus harbinensis]|uniref:Helix-turn-helix domain-containing protein n=1 Tax=Schleiferilactobacillus harbinensis TaxID=304207 RepID=A0ABU7SVD2_9LACO
MQLQVTTTPEFEAQLQTMVRRTVAEMMQQPQAQQKAPDFLNLGQAADFIHLSRGTLNKLIKNGELKVTFIGSAKRISKAQLIQFMTDKAI